MLERTPSGEGDGAAPGAPRPVPGAGAAHPPNGAGPLGAQANPLGGQQQNNGNRIDPTHNCSPAYSALHRKSPSPSSNSWMGAARRAERHHDSIQHSIQPPTSARTGPTATSPTTTTSGSTSGSTSKSATRTHLQWFPRCRGRLGSLGHGCTIVSRESTSSRPTTPVAPADPCAYPGDTAN